MIVVDPVVTPVPNPLALIVATLGVPELHVTWLVIVCVPPPA
jgi:hypothetical protein